MVTSSGISLLSISSRTKSKSVSDAAGKPTSISLKPIWHEQLEHARLAVGIHRLDQRLVAVAQVDRAPDRRLGDDRCKAIVGRQIGMGLKATYFSPAVGIMGFWGDIERLSRRARPYRPLAKHCDGNGRVGGDWWKDETNDKRSAGPLPSPRGGGSANKSKRRQSQHGRQNRALPAGVNPPDGRSVRRVSKL